MLRPAQVADQNKLRALLIDVAERHLVIVMHV